MLIKSDSSSSLSKETKVADIVPSSSNFSFSFRVAQEDSLRKVRSSVANAVRLLYQIILQIETTVSSVTVSAWIVLLQIIIQVQTAMSFVIAVLLQIFLRVQRTVSSITASARILLLQITLQGGKTVNSVMTSAGTVFKSITMLLPKIILFSLMILPFAFINGNLNEAGSMYSQWINSNAPKEALKIFAASEAKTLTDAGIPDLKLDGMDVSSGATCVGGRSPIEIQNYLRKQLGHIPEAVREDIVEKAVVEGTSVQSKAQHTVSHLADEGKAHSYIAYWKTTYSGNNAVIGSNYNTCVVVSSVDIKVAEHLAGYNEQKEKIKIGSSPCKCGIFSCEQCPDYDDRVTKTPIFKRHALKLKEQEYLHRYMSKLAIESVIGMLDEPSSIRELASGSKQQSGTKSWKLPNPHAYIG